MELRSKEKTFHDLSGWVGQRRFVEKEVPAWRFKGRIELLASGALD